MGHTRAGKVAVLGRNIRSRPSEIARYCLAAHRAISEDVATIAESIALADRIFPRHRGVAWNRVIELEIPVFEISVFQRTTVLSALEEAVHFLTGDTWHLRFVKREGAPLSQEVLPFEKVQYRYVTPYSDGLDSYAQAVLLENEAGADAILKLRSARIGGDSDELQRPVLRVPRGFRGMPKKELTYRTRPFVFFSFAGIGAFVTGAEAVVIGESGQGALGPALVRYADEWPFRSTHPGFVSRIARYLELAFGSAIAFRMPQRWRTKGEVLLELKAAGLLGRWQDTSSCSVRPVGKHGASVCGVCGGCMLRSLAVHSAGLAQPKLTVAFDARSGSDVAADGQVMSISERHMAVRSLGTMAELSRLVDGDRTRALLESESMLLNEPDPALAANLMHDLISRHAAEWHGFIASLPKRGWARRFVEQL